MDLEVFWSFFFKHAIVLVSCFGLTAYAIHGNETDRVALLNFKAKITDDPLGVTLSWNTSINFCQWHGVTCGRRHQRVTMLDLRSLNLTGSISPHIGNLSFLRAQYLQNNSFHQEIPSQIGRLRRLQRLGLHNNSIGGKIPTNLSSCSNLTLLNIANNQLVGGIPVELGSLSKLQILSMQRNNLSGSIPPSLGNLSFLLVFSAPQNNLVGSIPDALGQLKKLTFLSFSSNRLSSSIPPSIYNLSSITTFNVVDNQIQGTLPSDLGTTLPNLELFAVAMNEFTGSIPASINNASNLVSLPLGINKFTGRVPSVQNLHRLQEFSVASNSLGSGSTDDLSFLFSLNNATDLWLLEINKNNFGGVLPEYISNFSTSLARFSVNDNKLHGSIPGGLGNLINLERLDMFNNRFSGNIPSDIGKLQKLVMLILIKNSLSGTIPSSLGNMTRLTQLVLSGNDLRGSIPPSLGECQNLVALDLSENNLNGTIPPQVIGLSSLSILLDLSDNHLIGALPMEVGNLKNLESFDLGNNMLSGQIPSTLSSCVRLEILVMGGNFFQSTIPSSLSSLRGLQTLDLSHNNLSGEIPEFLRGFKLLQYLDLSYNDFEGKVPTEGVFENASAVWVMRNNKLCGGIPEFHLPACNLGKSNKRILTHRLKSIIAIVSVLLGVTLVLSFLFFLRFRKKRKETTSSSYEALHLRVSYQSLLKATNGFSSANLIGVGSFGTVYKGILDEGRTIVAVKVLNLLHRGASRSFMAECEALRNIRHRNLVKVLTACSSVDYHGNDFKALVYDYMINGSLDDCLHSLVGINEVDESPRSLNFLQRLNISIDVACALEYLHHHCETPIVHCDLKPSNVLLNDEMTAHVGDFGLAKFLSQGSHNATTNQSSSVGVRGTIGYAPPEYGMGSEVSTFGDVYSYGILLLEMFTGKRPTDDMFKEGLNLHNFVKAALPEQVAEIVEPVLLGERDEGETSTNRTRNRSHTRSHVIQECLILIFETGVACSADLPGERMNMSDVVVKLNFVREKLLRTRIQGQRHYAQTVQSAGTQG